MILKDITTDTQTHYRLTEGEQSVFFLWNRSGEITFELTGARAEAHIFAFFTGNGTEGAKLCLTQKHSAPHTTSSALVKSVLHDASTFTYEGLIHITKEGEQTDASQESRTLLLSRKAKAFTRPSLEILANDVRCRHAATVSPLSKEALFLAQSRGLSNAQATTLLTQGFFQEAFDALERLGIHTDTLQQKILSHTK